MKKLLNGIIGGFLGGIIGFFVILIFSWSYDKINPPENNTGGMISVGWIFTLFTVPFFGIIGFIWFLISSPFKSKKSTK
ncbi:MAG: hypothetical protein WAO74_04625 [Polaribacter sp.]|uniref:hypothetical protein n=1 Tax=Polaribacter sp. TaxID=1920175 RepID=UPI003BAE71BB